jgi:prepilin-type N-terminal cleavage/methylation domain-containing protein
MLPAKYSSSKGFSLVEVLISMGLLTVVSLGVAQLFAVSTRANVVAKGQTSTTAMAEQKMEQLRGLTWGFDTAGLGLPLSDTSTNLAVDPQTATGSGLNPSPSNSIDQNVAGYVDYLDAHGTYVGTGTAVPAGASYIRRWSILPLPTNPNNTLIFQVLVTPASNEAARVPGPGPRNRMAGDAFLVSLRTRKAQ